MKSALLYNLTLLLILALSLHVPKLTSQSDNPGLINQVGINIGVNLPVGQEVLGSGAYPIGLNLYLTGTHNTPGPHSYELITGADIIVDYGGGIYLAVPILANWSYELANIGNRRFVLSSYSGLGYTFHHIFSRMEGIIVKNQHTLGLDAGLKFDLSLGLKWNLNFRMGIFHSFTGLVQANFAETSVISENKFNYTTIPFLIGFSRKIGKPQSY